MGTSLDGGSATTLADFLSDAFPGAMEDSGLEETPKDGSSPDAGGTPPLEPAQPDSGSTAKAEGEVAQDPTKGGSQVDPAAGAPDKAAQPDQPELDIAKAVPLTYTVDKEQRTFEDIKVIPGVGAVISADALPKLQQRLSQADHLYERSQQEYRDRQAMDAITTWRVRGDDGAEKTLTGRDGIEAQRVAHAQTTAALQTLSEALTNPEVFASLVGLDKEGNIVLNRSALDTVMTRSELAEMRAMQAVRNGITQQYGAASTQPREFDYTQAAPAIAEHYAKEIGQGVLTAEDHQFLAQQVRGYIRPATAEDLKGNPALQLGQQVVDPAFASLVQRMADLKKSSATAVTTAEQATRQNEARLAGVITPGRKAAPTAPAQPARTAQNETDAARKTKADEAFALQERMMTGRW